MNLSLFDDTPIFPELLCGVDEAGRGPLAGAVFAAAVILDPCQPIAGLRDSKKLTEAKREALAEQIKQHALAWAVAQASVEEVDELNVLHASMLAMQRAVAALSITPVMVLVDGNRRPVLSMPVEAIVKGDDKIEAISAASILAKTARDADMLALHAQYPQYAFDQHKGYGTAVHLARLAEHGPCVAHRKSFAPVAASLQARAEAAQQAAQPAAPILSPGAPASQV